MLFLNLSATAASGMNLQGDASRSGAESTTPCLNMHGRHAFRFLSRVNKLLISLSIHLGHEIKHTSSHAQLNQTLLLYVVPFRLDNEEKVYLVTHFQCSLVDASSPPLSINHAITRSSKARSSSSCMHPHVAALTSKTSPQYRVLDGSNHGNSPPLLLAYQVPRRHQTDFIVILPLPWLTIEAHRRKQPVVITLPTTFIISYGVKHRLALSFPPPAFTAPLYA
jgi:hypothetical protein